MPRPRRARHVDGVGTVCVDTLVQTEYKGAVSVYPEMTRTFNIVIVIAIVIIGVIVLLARRGPASALARADRYSMTIRLPYGVTPGEVESTRASVARVIGARTFASDVALVTSGLLSAALLGTPLATSSLFVLTVFVPCLVVGSVIGAVVVSLRERLFHPAPDARRVAHVRFMRTSDYLDPARRLLPWALGIAAAVVVATAAAIRASAPARVDGALVTIAVALAAVAMVVFAVVPWLERLVLAQPQPASDTLQLAWDDSLRTGTLSELRLAAALSAWFALAVALVALWQGDAPGTPTLATQLPTWGMIALQFVYPITGRRLRTELYPDWLRRPVSQGSPA